MREHGLHAGVGDRLDGGEVPTARDERGDDLLHLGRRDVAQDLREPSALPVARCGRSCASRATSCRRPGHRSRPARTRRGTGCGRRVVWTTAARGARRGSARASPAWRPRTRPDARTTLASRRLPITSLISPLAYCGSTADHAELEQQVLHVTRELLAARGVAESGPCSCRRYDTHAVALEQRLQERLLHVAGRPCHTNSGTRLSALCIPMSSASGLCRPRSMACTSSSWSVLPDGSARAATYRVPPTTGRTASSDGVEVHAVGVVEPGTSTEANPSATHAPARNAASSSRCVGDRGRTPRARRRTRRVCRARSRRGASTGASGRRRRCSRQSTGWLWVPVTSRALDVVRRRSVGWSPEWKNFDGVRPGCPHGRAP